MRQKLIDRSAHFDIFEKKEARLAMREMLCSKIHRATVTQADLDYEGSVTIDDDLLQAAGILEFEAVHIWNVTRGTRLVTYAMRGEAHSGVVCINGAAAHLMKPGDTVIIATYCRMEEAAAKCHHPTVVLVDEKNRVKEIRGEVAGPNRP